MNLIYKVLGASAADSFVNGIIPKIVDAIVKPIITLVFVLAAFYFIWGLFGLFYTADPSKNNESKNHILWGTIGMAIMVSVYGLIRFVASTVGQTGALGF